MKIRLLMFAFLAAGLVAFSLIGLPAEAAPTSVPCHECSALYDDCASQADSAYATCLASGLYTVAACQSQHQTDLDTCDLAESACYSTCFECENGGGEGF
jgi:hypothetical protein